ncbi:MAG: cobalamin B12-binding domain-containing protein [Candidatus Helarchaeota archaeon]
MTLNKIKELIIDLNVDEIKETVQAELDAGTDPKQILQVLTEGMDEVGRLYERKEYFLTDLILAGETMKDAMTVLNPYLKADEQGNKGKIICATVKGDNHDIGKNILITMLISAGYEIIDLGTNCPANKIIKAIKKTKAKVIALSCLLTMTIEEIKNIVDALKSAGLRDKVKIIVGGAPLNMEIAKKMGTDDYANDAIDGVRHINILMEG